MKYFYTLLVVILSTLVQAQTSKGKIINSEGIAISDVYVQNIQNKSHAHSNYKGEFNLENSKIGDSISISHKNFDEKRTVIIEAGIYALIPKAVSLKEVVITNWYGVLAPAGTSPQIVERLSQELARIVQLPDVRERLNGAALEPMQSTPQLFSEHIATELSKWEFIVREAKIQID